jgi:hypothetical protein
LSAGTVEPKSSTNEIPGASGRLSDIIQRSGHSTNARYLRLVTSIEETDASPGEAATRVQSNASMT